MPRDEETLQKIIDAAAQELQQREKARDEALTRARKARQLSKQAILLDHNNQRDKAESNLADARRLLDEIRPHAEAYPELDQYEEVEAAHEEHAEAIILHALLTKNKYPTPEQASASPTRYLLGLGDVPGELRREALDALRTGDLEAAEKHLARMEQIYLHLVAMEDASLLKGLRRKLDIARAVIEATRSEVTAETGRRRLSDQLKRIEKA
jgi:translin